MPRPTPEAVTLAVLAGGGGTRMGTPKAWLSLGERPVLDYLLDRLGWPGPTLLVTAPGRERPPGCARFTREVRDPVADQGPLRGLLTALEHLATPMLAVVTVDMPAVRPSDLLWLAEALSAAAPPALGVMPRRRTTDGGEEVEPFPSAFLADAAPAVRRHLASGGRSVRSLLFDRAFRSVAAPDTWPPEAWTNLNTPADLHSFVASRPGRPSAP